jgi:Peptidase family S41
MKGIHSFSFGLFVLLNAGVCLQAEPDAAAPDFQEVYNLIRAHATGLSEADLNRNAVQALVASLKPKVTLAGRPTGAPAAEASVLTKAMLFEGPVAYLRLTRVDSDLAKAVREACRLMASTNKLSGLVLDLRYAGGDDYAAAAATADLFLKKETPLLDWGQGVVQSKDNPDALALPVAVLVNRETSEAAEGLAAVLRETGVGLILGAPTAGQAVTAEEFPLKNGQRLRIATGSVRLADGAELSPQGVKPDIAVDINPADERAYFNDGYKELGKTNVLSSMGATNQPAGTNRTRRARYNEAELVRERKEGFNPDVELTTTDISEKPLVRDPVLARALDVLKGLAVVRASRGS